MNFPAIYNLVVPVLRYIQWAFLEGFDVSLLGNRRKIKNHIIPEAYVCQFNFRSLTLEPANFVDEICEERTNLGSFAAYSAEQKKQEKEFQKATRQREAARLAARKYREQQAQLPQIPVEERRSLTVEIGPDELGINQIIEGLSQPFAAEGTVGYLQDLQRENPSQYENIISGLYKYGSSLFNRNLR